MADAYTTTSSVGIDQGAWDRLAYYAFRPNNYFDQLADVQPTNQSMPGSSVTFTQVNDLTPTAATLSESVDVDAVALSDAQVTLTLAEYGNAVITTAKLRATAFIPVDPIVAQVIGVNAAQSLDLIAANVIKAGTNVRYTSTTQARVNVAAGDKLTAANVRRAYTDLENANTPKWNGGFYAALIHPDVKYDLRAETGSGSWRVPKEYSEPGDIWNGELGEFEGFRFLVTTTAPVFANSSNGAGSTGTVDVYRTLFLGRQGLAKAHATTDGYGAFPTVVDGPVVDKLRRFVPMGWKWLGTYGIFRQGSIRAVESSSTIGVNT